MKVGVLAVQGDVAEHASALADCGAHVVELRGQGDLAGIDALVLPGGESTTMSMLLESSGLFDAVATRLRDGMPAFGTCAGMILLATEVLDGRPDQRSFGVVDIGPSKLLTSRDRPGARPGPRSAGPPWRRRARG